MKTKIYQQILEKLGITPPKKPAELMKRTDVQGTPFTVITTEAEGSVVTLGKYRVSPPFEKEQEAIDYVKSKDWNLLLSAIMLIVEEEVKRNLEERNKKADKQLETLTKQYNDTN